MSKKAWLVAIIAVCVGLGARALYDNYQQTQQQAQAGALQSDGQPFNLYNVDDPRPRIVYFGYTHCPDVCPTSLAVLSAALKSLPESTQKAVSPVFITLDPKRDTSEKAAEYAHFFHPLITGVSGSRAQIDQLAKRYGVLYRITELEDSAMDYAVDHSSFFYFLSPDGELLEKIPHTLNPDMLVAAVQRVTDNDKE
ncbi:SCO family protein [Salinivibrio sp. MA427]|uniref:SCO family protein n=1 Tax=Salinivibrio costicola subsp. alcaliphilus TaxID=272773 RepID=A0ABX3KQR6_SALCS|nr:MULTISPECIES: SCO family protein [Salinivibrio]OOE98222.1 SCO family protein [Salinivibrio sp. MA427]OOF34065.1 SCO family protein [Salinivibrio costicola subsp. alcaliphilus]